MIRLAVKNDLDDVHRLIRQLSRHKFTKEQFEDCYLYNFRKENILVYEKNYFIRGCLAYDFHYNLHFSRKSAEIVNLIVDENYRGQGIGKDLLIAFEQIENDNGCVCLEVYSGRHRQDADRFYMREGFSDTHKKLTKEF